MVVFRTKRDKVATSIQHEIKSNFQDSLEHIFSWNFINLFFEICNLSSFLFLLDFYSQWYHQTFFTVDLPAFLLSLSFHNQIIYPFILSSQLTELFSTTFVLHLANKENSVTSRKVLCIVGTSLLHIIAGSVDQFIQNVFLGEGKLSGL